MIESYTYSRHSRGGGNPGVPITVTSGLRLDSRLRGNDVAMSRLSLTLYRFYFSTFINRCRTMLTAFMARHRPSPSARRANATISLKAIRTHTLSQAILLGILITTLAACAPAPTQPGGLDPLGTAAVTEAQARAARQQLERIAKATQEAQTASASATETARQSELAATRAANEAAQQAQAARLASEVRATDQAMAAEATAQHIQVIRAAQEIQTTQTAVAVTAYNQRLAAEANATATAIEQQQRVEMQRVEAEQTRQRNEAIWQVLLISVGTILGTVVLVFIILSVRPAVVKMWDAFMRSRETMARIRAAAQHPLQIVNEPHVPQARAPSHRHRFGNEDILAKWDAKGVRDVRRNTRREGDLESTRSMVIEPD